jgi:hypothetical protein
MGLGWIAAVGLLVVIGVVGATPERASALPGNRAYELVSPPDTGGVDAQLPVALVSGVTPDGKLVWGNPISPIGESSSGGGALYSSVRTADGWQSTSLLPSDGTADFGYEFLGMAPDLSQIYIWGRGRANEALGSTRFDKTQSLLVRSSTGAFASIFDAPYSIDGAPSPSFRFDGASADGQQILYTLGYAPAGPFGAPGALQAYQYAHGTSVPVGVDDAGDPLSTCATSAPAPSFLYPAHNPISADGSVVYLLSPASYSGCADAQQIYRRSGGHTVEISAPDAGVSSSPLDASFVGASSDGKTAYFTTAQQLTASDLDTEVDLYQFTVGAPLRCLSCTSADGAGGVGVASATTTADGSHVFYVTTQALDGVGSDGSPNLYVSAGAGAGRTLVTSTAPPFLTQGALQATDDAGTVVWTDSSFGALYVASREGGGYGPPACVSCTPDGVPFATDLSGGDGTYYRNLSADGHSVVFMSLGALTAEVHSAGRSNVFIWHDGTLSLLSSGQGRASSRLLGMTPSADDVFFTTFDRLVPQAPLSSAAIYDARVDGGFPPGSPGPALCVEDACQPSSGPGAGVPAAGSATFVGPGNVKVARPPLTATAKKSVRGSTTFAVTVTVAEAGQLTVAGAGLTTIKKTLDGRGTVSVRVRLTARAKRTLGRKHRLKVKATVTYRPSGGAALRSIVSVTLKA